MDRIVITRVQHRWYVLGAPALARLAQCVGAARAGRRRAAVVAGVLAGLSVVASVLFTAMLLYAGWLGAQHRDVHALVWPGLLTLAVTGLAGLLSELPRLDLAPAVDRGGHDPAQTRVGRTDTAFAAAAAAATGLGAPASDFAAWTRTGRTHQPGTTGLAGSGDGEVPQ